MSALAPLTRFTEADGQVDRMLHLAEKALTDGKPEKASAYALLAMAWQGERDVADQQIKLERA